MERKFRFDLIWKEMKRLWWLAAALLGVAVIAILVYSFALYTPRYTYEAGESIYVEIAPTAGDKMNISKSEELSELNRRINDATMREYLNGLVKTLDSSVEKPGNAYDLEYKDGTMYITVTMNSKAHSETVAENYLARVKEIIAGKTYDVDGLKTFSSQTYVEPELKGEAGLTPLKLAIFGVVGIIVLYFIVVFLVFYFNKRLYDAREFQENFKAPVLESDAEQNGYRNVAIKLSVQSEGRDKPYVLALAKHIDAELFAKQLQKEGFSVLKTEISSALSQNRELREEDGIDVIFGTDGHLKTREECKKDLVEKYPYDYILVSAEDKSAEKDFITAASVADGTILGFDLKKDDFKAICGVFEELEVVKELNLLGVVL